MKSKLLKAARLLSLLIVTALTLLFGSCDGAETTDSTGFILHYYGVTDIGPSMSFTLPAPTYKGNAPYDFTITDITLNDGAYTNADNFIIDAETGAITIQNTEAMSAGLYNISVNCYSNGKSHNFKNAIQVNMLLAVPEGVSVEPAEVLAKMEDENWWEASAKVTTDAEKHVSIVKYEFAEDESKEYLKYFSISNTGIITFNPDYKDRIIPGEKYVLSLKLTTKAGEHLYPDAVTFNVISKPLGLLYKPNTVQVEQSTAHESQLPTIQGSEGMTYSIKSISPEATGFTIDATTGQIKLAENSPLTIGNVYKIDVTVANEYGPSDFVEAYVVSIVDYIEPIQPETFSYVVPETYEEKAYKIPVSQNFIGGEALFSFINNTNLIQEQIDNNRITIDNTSGTISIMADNTLIPGNYTINVKVTGPTEDKGEATTAVTLNIKANPNKFTFYYGNNIDLTPAKNYADQFSFKTLDAMKAYQFIPTTTLGDRSATWKITAKIGGNKYTTGQGVTINERTGEIDPSTITGFQTGQMKIGVLVVEATCGSGDLAYTVTAPIFIRTEITKNSTLINYKPFAVKVNPKKGGASDVPTLQCPDATLFAMDYRRDFFFFDIDLDATDALITEPGLLNDVWTYFYETYPKITVNTGSRKPVSAYDTENKFDNTSNLDKTLLYIRPSDKVLIVNKDVWKSANGTYANGIFIAGMTYKTDGATDPAGSSNQFSPIAVWFDENFE